MVRLREIPRTATFAWSPGSDGPPLVTGTRAGAVDADFSDESKLELWQLALDDQQQGLELQPVATLNTESSFHDIAWGCVDSDHPKGIVAGAMENGSLGLWDAEKLLSGGTDALISQTSKHSGAIKSIQFNPLRPQILATAGAKGEIFIYDVNDIENPLRLGNPAARADDIETLAWNRKMSNILATGGAGGFVTIWDLKKKKATLTLNNNRKAVSAIAWDPINSTKLLTATPDDNTPVIFLWDLRNSNAPERTLQGHEQGVLSLSWCTQDSNLLMSSGKDSKTIIWNPQTGERYGELPEVANWTFQTRFSPMNPNLSATASFDGKITIQTLQNTNPDTSQSSANKNLDDEEFFQNAQNQPQGASWSLTKAPKWFERPVGATFGFGGKVVVFKPVSSQSAQSRSSKVVISQFSVDSDVSSATEQFQTALASGNITSICEERKEQAKTDEEKADWEVMATLAGENPRGKIVEFLGFKKDELANGDLLASDDSAEKPGAEEKSKDADERQSKRLSTMFDGGDGDAEGDEFLSNITATKGAKTDSPFHLISDDETSVEKGVTKALMLGDFAKATAICLKEERFADAFLIANCGDQQLVEKVQSAYLARKKGEASYMRLLSSVIDKNLWDVVYNADLQNWKETMAIVCTFSDPSEFSDLCEALGDRIKEQGERKDASFCYLVGSKLEKVVSIWASELEESEQAGMKGPSEDSTFSVHARSLQNFIEKVTIFREVFKYRDEDKSLSSGWKLSALYDKYTEYADILAGHGQLDVAQKYLDLLPANYPAAEVARNRVKLATQKPTAAATSRPANLTSRTSSRAQPVAAGYQPPQPVPNMASQGSYAPFGQNQIPTPQPQSYLPPLNQYQPQGAYQPAVQPGYPKAGGPPPMAGPPRNPTPSGPPPSKAKNMENWNDVPLVSKPPPRRSTPSVAPITSPFSGQQSPSLPGPPQPQFGQTVGTPPPPPKGSAPPRGQSPFGGPPSASQGPPKGPPQGPPRPSSTSTNPYAPPPPQTSAATAPPVHGVPPAASPYNAPPAGPPPSNRYAPSPMASQPSASPMPPPMQGNRPPPSNQYGPPPQQQAAGQSAYAPSPYPAQNQPWPQQQQQQQQQPPPPGPPPMGRQGPPPAATPTPPPTQAAAPPKAKHPSGDRSHIPANAQGLVEILSQDMQRVAAKAPATYAPQVKDAQKRLNILFDHLNNEELVQPDTIDQLSQLASAIQSRDYDTAQKLQVQIQRDKTEECGNWMVGVKRLLTMSKATPA